MWMCGVKLKDRLPSKELRERLGIDDIALVLQRVDWIVCCCQGPVMLVVRRTDQNTAPKLSFSTLRTRMHSNNDRYSGADPEICIGGGASPTVPSSPLSFSPPRSRVPLN